MTPEIRHHIDPATLMAYSAGSLGEALSAVAAAHIEMCAHCRRALSDLDMVGAMLLVSLPSKAESGETRTAPPKLPGTVVPLAAKAVGAAHSRASSRLPETFGKKIGVDLRNVPWRRLGPGVWHHPIALSAGVNGDLRLLRIAAGRRMPSHGHGGSELTLVLDGAYSDENGTYSCGDIQDIDGDDEHRPVAHNKDGCICIIASEKPARYKSLLNRLLQPLTGI